MEDWAEVQRLFQREGLTKTAIARRLGMSRTTVIRLLELSEPPRYTRRQQGSQLDPFADQIAAMLAADAGVAATVICERLPHYGAHVVVFTLGCTMADFLAALPGCLARLGGVAERAVCDNDASIVARREGGRARLHPEVAALFGALRTAPVVLAPRRPQSKGHAERTIRYLETSFCPLRDFRDLADLQIQHDTWAIEVAFRRTLRRTGARVVDRWNVERRSLHPLPEPLPDTDLRLEARAGRDAFVRVCGVDYSVPPAFVGRRVAARVSPTTVRLWCEGTEIAVHRRSFVPADVVLAPAHGRAIRLAREARDRLTRGDVELAAPDLARYDALVGVTP